jgi:hypothetical protein
MTSGETVNSSAITSHRTSRLRCAVVVATALATLLGLLAVPVAASAAAGVPVTYLDQPYSSSVNRPSENKPQSKLWFHDGSWWALMVTSGGSLVHVHELMPDHTWRDTGVQVDSRVNSTGDALWSAADGRLYVASRATGSNLQINAFGYDPVARSWPQVPGFPVTVQSGGGSESATIDQDSTGKLWVTYTRASRVWVAHSAAGDPRTWTAGFVPDVPDADIKSDDLSALIAFGSSVGVMWSDQVSGAFRFAIHRDGDADDVWRVEDALTGPFQVDDHLNLKQLVGDAQGRIFAAIKTSANDPAGAAPGDTLVGVLTRTPRADGTGSWQLAPAGTVADDHTRPIIMIDATNQELYFFATSPGQGGDIVYKKTPLSDVSFAPGRGAPFVDAAPLVNNATGAKDPVTAETGLVILAVAEGQKRYVHAEMDLAGGSPVDRTAPTVTTSPAAGAAAVPVPTDVTATFSEPVQGVSGSTFQLADAAGTAIAATVTQGAGNQWVLHPTTALAAGASYTGTLTGGPTAIRDLADNALQTQSWSFSTANSGGTGAPTVTARVPAENATSVAPGTNVTGTFSEKVQGVDPNTFTLTDPTGRAVGATVTGNSTATKWVLNPAANLAKDTTYTATLTGGATAIRDLSGTPLATVSWTFTTGPAPRVSSHVPASGATGVSRTGNVTATFSEPVQNVGTGTFSLRDSTGALVPGGVSRNGTTNTWILDPTATLAARVKYTVTVTGGPAGVRDLAGNPLAGTVTWTFTTGA